MGYGWRSCSGLGLFHYQITLANIQAIESELDSLCCNHMIKGKSSQQNVGCCSHEKATLLRNVLGSHILMTNRDTLWHESVL